MNEAIAAYATPRIRDLRQSELPQERLERLGPAALSDTELLAMLVRSGSKGLNALGVASRLLDDAGSLAGLVSWQESQFRSVKGIGKVKALQLVAVVELCRRALAHSSEIEPVFDAPEKVYAHMKAVAMGLEVEKFWTLALNRKNRLLRLCETTSGTASNCLAHPREIFREAIRNGACAIICVHNHPSGDPAPSGADLKITRQLREASKVLAIDLLDHVIVGHPGRDPAGQGYYSFQQAGIL